MSQNSTTVSENSAVDMNPARNFTSFFLNIDTSIGTLGKVLDFAFVPVLTTWLSFHTFFKIFIRSNGFNSSNTIKFNEALLKITSAVYICSPKNFKSFSTVPVTTWQKNLELWKECSRITKLYYYIKENNGYRGLTTQRDPNYFYNNAGFVNRIQKVPQICMTLPSTKNAICSVPQRIQSGSC